MSVPNENLPAKETAASTSAARLAKIGVRSPVLIQLFTAAGFATAHFRDSLSHHAYFGKLMQMEFIAIHSGLFIGVFVLARPDTGFWRGMRWVAVTLLSVFYLKIGYSILGWVGVLELAALTLSTYAGLFWAKTEARFRLGFEIGARWFVGFMAFGLIGRVFDMPSQVNDWENFPAVLLYGATYFAVLAVIEATGIYRRIRA